MNDREERIKRLEEQVEKLSNAVSMPTRRETLAAGGLLGAGALLGGGAGDAEAATVGQVGTDTDRVDVFGASGDFDSVSTATSFTDPAGVKHTGELADIDDVGGGGGALTFDIPTVELADTEGYRTRYFVPNGTTLNIDTLGVQNDANNAPTGLTADVYDETNATTPETVNSTRTTSTATVTGPAAVAFAVVNSTGTTQLTSGFFQVTES